MKQHTTTTWLVPALLAAVLLTASAPAIMLSCDATTAGRAITFSTGVQGATVGGDPTTSFQTGAGWDVTLNTAHAVFGPIYFYGGEPMARGKTVFPSWGTAMACPCHAQYDYGAVLGEVLEQYVVDLLERQPTSTGEVKGEAGTCRSTELHIHPPGDQHLPAGSPAAEFEKLEGHSIMLRGTASKAADSVSFRAVVDIPDEGTMRIVQNIAGDVDLDDTSNGPGKIVVQVLLDAWLDQVDFSSLNETDEDDTHLFTEDTQARSALLQAVRNRYSYRVVWSEQ